MEIASLFSSEKSRALLADTANSVVEYSQPPDRRFVMGVRVPPAASLIDSFHKDSAWMRLLL